MVKKYFIVVSVAILSFFAGGALTVIGALQSKDVIILTSVLPDSTIKRDGRFGYINKSKRTLLSQFQILAYNGNDKKAIWTEVFKDSAAIVLIEKDMETESGMVNIHDVSGRQMTVDFDPEGRFSSISYVNSGDSNAITRMDVNSDGVYDYEMRNTNDGKKWFAHINGGFHLIEIKKGKKTVTLEDGINYEIIVSEKGLSLIEMNE